ncbi:4'-phosphopantetheinyl transferase superfamily protein [uncultured Gimesia sp.]|uniref:4'-phosphopantetheinyl transferase family protein n=1 Tax=uncultured Gimesia sp. TaxID=1678688 RepID=UPI002621E946|nr:4'-phosphopantetheinyl transferase superfamily protein [uncultured Gimesia sp.]
MSQVNYHISSIAGLESEWLDHDASWISLSEQEQLDRLRHQDRRREWLAGRWLCKHMIQEELSLTCQHTMPLSVIEIESLYGGRRTSRPRVIIDGQMQSMEISITHSNDWIGVALATKSGCSIGIDLVSQTLTNKHSLDVWLTENEKQGVAENSDELPIIWSIKESVYKASNRGELFRPLEMEVYRTLTGEYACHYKALTEGIDYSIMVDRHADHIFSITTIKNDSLAGVL